MRIVLMGPPGAGKGTQAKLISLRYDIPHISTGDIFRKNISRHTGLGLQAKEYIENGDLVPDSITISLVLERLSQGDCQKGFLLDGFPRSLDQAKALDQYLEGLGNKLDAVVLIDVSSEFILDRMTGRRSCPVCGASYHIKYNPPATPGKCDVCGNSIIHREDDTEETLKERLEVYLSQTSPLVGYYENKDILFKVDGSKDIDLVFENISKVLEDTKK
ncbi:adenylate kinase [Clostridium sp. N3C]|uniref:adenylate kinase n=1 Tax=Clostridium sp. N3C TaxID=1776758 RepID=UPI000944E142|nr:adenylate kinase [Clostridium sp. N3C]